MRDSYIYFLLFSLFLACSSEQQPEPDSPLDKAQEIIDAAIAAHGGNAYNHTQINFKFRDRDYISIRNGGKYQYERRFTNPEDSLQQVRDILTNDAFVREINGAKTEVPDTMAFKYSNSVNSVIYFAVLPYGLNDPAVNKEYVGAVKIKGEPYHKIKVTFEQEGGGKDYEDVFLYWIHTASFHMDYLAYSYKTDGGGIRFREAFNQREVGGIQFADYVNYKMDPSLDLMKSDSLFEAGELEKLSVIALEGVRVKKVNG